MAESEEELKSLLMKVKEESEKVGLKLNIQKMKIMASGPITPWEIDGKTVETVSDFFWGGFLRQEYRSGMSPGDLPDSGIQPRYPALQAASLPAELPRKPP